MPRKTAPSKSKNKKKARLILAVLVCTASALLLFYFRLCPKQCKTEAVKKKTAVGVKQKKPAKPQPSAYYCIDRHSVYYRQKRKYGKDIEKLKRYYIKKHDSKYDLAWEKKENKWYLDTSKWSFSLKGKKNKKVKVKWSRRPCAINKSKTRVYCPVVAYHGILWKLKFSQFEGGFIKLELYRVPITEEAKQKRDMAKFFGVVEKNDIDICLRVGDSPIKEILSSDTILSKEE